MTVEKYKIILLLLGWYRVNDDWYRKGAWSTNLTSLPFLTQDREVLIFHKKGVVTTRIYAFTRQDHINLLIAEHDK
jgi:hypothetical protein